MLRRELGPFAVRVIMNSLLFLFVFTFLFPRIGEGFGVTSNASNMNFGTILLPGLTAVAIMFTGVAIEKICFSARQCILPR